MAYAADFVRDSVQRHLPEGAMSSNDAISAFLERMEANFIRETWQLKELSNTEWSELNAPLGLVACVRKELREGNLVYQDQCSPKHETKAESEQNMRQDGASSSAEEHINRSLTYGDGFCGRVWMEMSFLWSVGHVLDLVYPRDHQESFKRTIIHAKTGTQLCDHFVIMCEVWIISFSVLLGSLVGMWEIGVPTGCSDEVHLGFELVMAITQVLLLCAIVLNAVLLINMSAVHPSKAKQFALLCINTFQLAELLVLGGIMFYLGTVLYITITRLDAAWHESWTPRIVVLVVYWIGFAIMYYAINFMSMMNMHGGLMEPPDEKGAVPVTRATPETNLGRTVNQELYAVESAMVQECVERASVAASEADCALLAQQCRMRRGDEVTAEYSAGKKNMMFKKRRGTGEKPLWGDDQKRTGEFTALGQLPGMGSTVTVQDM